MSSYVYNRLSSGGGAQLNYTVVGGTTQPSSASENTIWVNTSTTIGNYDISDTQLQNPSAGDVWIKTNPIGKISFEALTGDNTVNVNIDGVYQYISSAWALQTAYIYQS